MSKDVKALILLLSVATLIAVSFFLVATRIDTHNVSNGPENNAGVTNEKITEKASTERYENSQMSQGYEQEEWFLVHDKKYGYSYFLPNNEYQFRFYVEVFTNATTTELADFVKEIWTLNEYNENPYITEESISEPKEVVINDLPAYQMIVNGGFEGGDRSFVVEGTEMFTFFEAPQGVKLVTHHPIGTTADATYAQIMKSFRVSEGLIPPKEQPASWQEVSKQKYKISFPANLFVIADGTEMGDDVVVQSSEKNVYGAFSFSIEEQVFDANNIQGMYGKIDNAEKTTIQGRDWYRYQWGDAGCLSEIYETSFTEEQTAHMSFFSCMDEVYPIVEDEPLQLEILNTISFF